MDESPHPEDSVAITDESAVIVWDSAHKKEHFIRTATFQGATKDLGFIVPTPDVPELAAANKAVFPLLKKALEPQVIEKTNYHFNWSLLLAATTIKNTFNAAGNQMTDDDDAAARVDVLQRREVAGYDATSLKASDAGALARWLTKNGYVARSDLADWLRPYVDGGWVVTAFKIKKDNRSARLFSSSLVRMTFDTPKPFYPYREPSRQRQGKAKYTPRSLRVFFLGSERMDGAIGDAVPRAWPGEAEWSDNLQNHLDGNQQAELAKYLALPAEAFSDSWRMTTYQDLSYPRPGFDDLYFQPASHQETLLPPPIITWHDRHVLIPLDIIFAFGIPPVLFVLDRRRNKKKAGAK